MLSHRIIRDDDVVVPEISVVVPAFNSARTIERCMKALASQLTARTFEVIVVHSGADDTSERARRSLPPCRTFELGRPATPPEARNFGAKVARGPILGFIDSDIYVTRDWVENVANAIGTGSDIICGSIENGNPGSAVSRAEQLLMFNEFLPDSPQRRSWFALSGNMVMARQAYERYGPFVEVRAAEDIVFSRKVLAAGGSVLFYPALKVLHDNRTHLGAYLRNQWLIGKHTARARRMVSFGDTGSYTLFVLLLPVSPAAKLAKILWRLARWNPRRLRQVVRESPLFLAGLCVYCASMAQSVVRDALSVRAAEQSGGG